MFDFIRQHTKLMGFLLALLIIPAFVLFGIGNYSSYQERSEAVAEVGSQTITREMWEQSHQREIERIRESIPGIDIKKLDTAQARYATLLQMVNQQLLMEAANDMRITVSDGQLARNLLTLPVIANLRDANGKLDSKAYADLLARQGMSPEMFEANVRAEMSSQLVGNAVSQTVWMPPELSKTTWNVFHEQRVVEMAEFNPQSFLPKVQVNSDDLQRVYQANAAAFTLPLSLNVEYVILDRSAVAASVAVKAEDIRAYYAQNKDRFAVQGGKVPAFEEVKKDIEAQFIQEQSRNRYAELAEQFTNTVYEQSDSLSAAAALAKTNVKSLSGLTQSKLQGDWALPQVWASLTQPEALTSGRNLDVIDLGNNRLLAVRVVSHQPQRVQPFEGVRQEVERLTRLDLAAKAAVAEGQKILQQAKEGSVKVALSRPTVISRSQASSLPAAFVNQVMQAPASTLPAWVGVDLGSQGYRLAKISQVAQRAPADASLANQERAQLESMMADTQARVYLQYLRQAYKVKVLVPEPQTEKSAG
ncbi:MAG: hypothetical protein RLZZ397_122 [Pseudomonadota bacterium]|jgi:hypothetical protein